MLRFFIEVLLGPVKPPKHHAQVHGETRPCNVVGGCGAGCLCVPEQAERRPGSEAPGSDRRTPPNRRGAWPPDRQNIMRKAEAMAWEG